MQPAHTYAPSVELAERYNLTNDHLASLCRKSTISAERAGKVWMVDEESLKSYLARMRREREERRRALSERFKRELEEAAELRHPHPSGAAFSPNSLEWAFAVVLIVAFSTGLARAGEVSPLEPVRPGASVAWGAAGEVNVLTASALASVKQATAALSVPTEAPAGPGILERHIEDVRRGAAVVLDLAQAAFAANVEDTMRGARAVAAVARYIPETYGAAAAIFSDATFGATARAFVAVVELWGEGMSDGYAAVGESLVSGATLAGATLLASAGGELSAAIAVANASPLQF